MKRLWNIYQKKFKYAGEYTWDEVIHSVRELSIEAKLDVEKISVAEKQNKYKKKMTVQNPQKQKKDMKDKRKKEMKIYLSLVEKIP